MRHLAIPTENNNLATVNSHNLCLPVLYLLTLSFILTILRSYLCICYLLQIWGCPCKANIAKKYRRI